MARSKRTRKAAAPSPAAAAGQLRTDAGGRPQVDKGVRPIVEGSK
jgi:hypothetical protein